MITRLEATRYRCFARLGIDVGEFHVLVGANGSGKTTLIDIPALLGELLRTDNIASVFTMKRGEHPPRASALRELVFAGRGDDFSLAIEARMPESIRNDWAEALIASTKSKREKDKLRNSPGRWPAHLRYELRFEVFNERELHVKNEYLFAYPASAGPDRAVGGLLGEGNQDRTDWLFVLRREYGGSAEFVNESDAARRDMSLRDQVRIKPTLLALSAVKYKPDTFPAASWLYQFLTESVVFLSPDWASLRTASPPGLPKSIAADGRNIPWLALDLKRQDAPEGAGADYSSDRYKDWVAHVQSALPQVEAIDVREREDDHHAYFLVSYHGGFKVPSSGLSDGTLRILSLTLLPYLAKQPTILVTEEPENGIHPRAIEAVLQSLSSMYDSQVWVSSHSPVVLASAKLDQLLCARLTADGSVDMVPGNEHPRLKEWRGGIDLGSLFAAGVLG